MGGVDQPASPPSCFPPSSPEQDNFDMFDMSPNCLAAEIKPAAVSQKFQKALPPKVQRSVDQLMRDISLMHKADELLNDPFAMATNNLNGSCGNFGFRSAFH